MPSVLVSFQQTARLLYAGASPLTRFMQMGRPYICPMDVLVQQVPAGGRVLDVGCGNGLFSLHLVSTDLIQEAVGIDTSRSTIESAGRAATNLPERLRGRIRFETIEKPQDWPEGEFDAVVLIDMMHHVAVPIRRPLFLEAARRVARGGRLIYKDMRSRPIWRATMNRLHDLVLARQWITYCSPEAVQSWATEAGLRLRHHQEYETLWYAHELMIFDR